MAPGRRESQSAHDETYTKLVAEFGEKCAICKRTIGDAYPKEITSRWKIGHRIKGLEVEHKNNKPDDNRYKNKQLSCQACNLIKSLRNDTLRRALGDAMQRASSSDTASRAPNDGVERASEGVERVCVRERMQAIRLSVEYEKWSLEAKVSEKVREAFWKYLIGRLNEEERVEWEDALDSGAYVCRCSQEAIKRQLKALVSKPGPLKIVEDPGTLKKWVMWK